MPFIPYLEPISSKKLKTKMLAQFLGLNMKESCDPAQYRGMLNMSSDEYPYMAPRKERRIVDTTMSNPKAILGGDKLACVYDQTLYYDGQAVATGIESGRPQLVRMGAYIIVWPERIIYNTHTGELVQMDNVYKYTGVTVRPCMITGQEYTYTASDVAPANPDQYAYWYDTATGGFYQYLGDEWQGIDTVYSRLEGPGLGQDFHDYDVVTISGFSYDEYNLEAATVYASGEDYIVIATGTVSNFDETGNEVSITRKAPDMDFICENGNRLWGCSSAKHEIYGSKLGDPTNWHSYLGISTDSYAATVGSQGDWTGACAYMGYVHFWKEDKCHRLYGTRPENFQLVELPIRGVKAGCERSLCVVNGILYYVGTEGVMAFDGSSPVNLGDVLGGAKLHNAVAGAHGDKLYLGAGISTDDELFWQAYGDAGENPLFVLDTKRGLWHIEDERTIVGFAHTPDGDYCLDTWPTLWLIDGGQSPYQQPDLIDADNEIYWCAITGDFGMDQPEAKWVHKLTYRIKADKDAYMVIDIQYDNNPDWERALSYQAAGKRTETLKLRTRRCDHFRLRYMGLGRVLIQSLAVTYDTASERSGADV